MINGKTITLIIPCKNEAKILPDFMSKVPEYIDEVLIVDNNSTDNSAAIAESLGARVIRETRAIGGIGYGFAHMSGIKHAKSDIIVAMDGDDTYPIRSIRTIITHMQKKRLDFVSCTRLPLKNPKAISKTRQLGIHILNTEVALLYGYPVKDILTGMWVMTKKTAKNLDVNEGDWNFSPEVKLAAIKNPDIRFSEYHIQHFERANEPSKQKIFQTGWSHLTFILKRRVMVDSELYQFAKSALQYIHRLPIKISRYAYDYTA